MRAILVLAAVPGVAVARHVADVAPDLLRQHHVVEADLHAAERIDVGDLLERTVGQHDEIGRHVDEGAANVLVAIDPHEVADEGRETLAREEPPLATLQAPVLVFGEVHIQRDRRVAGRTDLGRIV